MRILHIDTGREMRGGQWQVLQLVRGLQQRGVECRLLARGPLLEAARAAGLNAQGVSFFRMLREASTFDLVHAHDARAHTLATVCGKPLIVSRRVAFPIDQGIASRWKYGRVTRFLAISHAVERELVQAGVPATKIAVVYDGVSIPVSVIPYDERPLACIAPATSDPMKGSDLVTASGIELQFSTNLADDLTRTKVLVYLSRQEGLGSAALLAAANATPVVASRIGGLVEAVEHEKTGLLVENDPAAVAAAVRRLQADPNWAAQLGLQGRERVKERFSVDHMVDNTLKAYGDVLR